MSSTTALTRDDQAAIVDLLYRYANSLDQRDWSLFRSIWTDDVSATYDTVGAWEGLDAFAAFMEKIHARCGPSLHRVTNPVVWEEDGRVRARSYVDALVLVSETDAMRAIGTYEDEIAATPAGWRIARRHYRMYFQQVSPLADAV
jgi:3-phenylpropionate/cinnamic acid dioxygenase small subunit